MDHINELIDNAGAEIATAGWLPGEDWSGTPLQSIYEIAAKRHYGVASMMFGLVEVGNNGALRPGSTACCVSLFARPKTALIFKKKSLHMEIPDFPQLSVN